MTSLMESFAILSGSIGVTCLSMSSITRSMRSSQAASHDDWSLPIRFEIGPLNTTRPYRSNVGTKKITRAFTAIESHSVIRPTHSRNRSQNDIRRERITKEPR